MESQTAVDESQSQAALDEFERRVIEMTHGVKDLLNKQGRKVAVLKSQKVELEKIIADNRAQLLRTYGYALIGNELQKINEEPCDNKVLGVDQNYSDNGSQNETTALDDGSQNENEIALGGCQNETTALDGSKIELSESQLAELEACRQELEEMKLNILKRESTLHKLGLTFEKLLQN
nr:uncharacterized protein LOC109161763 [Ipomoea batatas]